MTSILNFFPNNISKFISESINSNFQNLEEIRLRVNKPIILKCSNEEIIIPYNINSEEILRILQILCDNSIYTYQNQICNRFYNSARWTQGRNYRRCSF